MSGPTFSTLWICHILFRSCLSSPWETKKAVCQARMLSGRYRIEHLTKHWNIAHSDGNCCLQDCRRSDLVHSGSLENMLNLCPSLASARLQFCDFADSYFVLYPELSDMIRTCLSENPTQFWLDASVMPSVISASQI